MIWKVIVRPQAEQEMRAASIWYERERVGLGHEFLAAVESALLLIGQNPKKSSRRLKKRDVRSCRPQRFPYRIIYEIAARKRVIIVFAVLHASRDDLHWKRRLKDP